MKPELAAPSPPPDQLPLFQFLRMARDSSISTIPAAAFTRPYLTRKILWRRMLTLNHPEGVKHVLVDNAANYAKTGLIRRMLEPGIGRGLVTAEQERWQLHRRIMTPAFKQLDRYAPAMAEAASSLARRWDALPASSVIDASAAMMELTLGIIARTMFAFDPGRDFAVIEASLARYQREMRFGLTDFLGLPDPLPFRTQARARRALGGLDEAMARLLAGRNATTRLLAGREPKANDGTPDLLDLLLTAVAEGQISPQDLRDEVMTIFIAGHETTAQALSWAWYLLSVHPEHEALLHEEIDRLGHRLPGFSDLPALAYTRMVLEETMRLYPPVHTVSRQALQPDEVLGQKVAKGGMVFILPWILHRHRDWWEHPERFEPGRFAPDRPQKHPRYAYIPFGAGPRICLGASFAMTEAILILATLAQRYRLRPVPGHRVEPVGLITLRPREGLRLCLERRS